MRCKATTLDLSGNILQCPDPLDSIIHTICQSMPTRNIFLLGTYQAYPEALGLEYDLLVLIESKDNRPMHEFESLISNRCHDFAMITASVYKGATIDQLLKNGNIFFSVLCNSKTILFDSGNTALTKRKPQDCRILFEFLEIEFAGMLAKSKAFLSGAINYKSTGDHQLAAFMLHQTVEQTLNAFLSSLMGFRIQTHNLNKLLLYARRFSTQFYEVFPRNNDSEIQLYQTLHKAYIYGRYKNNFQVGEERLQILIDRATALLEMIESVFYQKVEQLRSGRFDFV